ncbi:hypothetical protein [Bacillus manliponensis]|uniref:Branched-chain amino acid aminotransferase n=1 Tax=Bacillus manliponensis TaxID=574376 RepID=A0A073K1P9_9BACI|nr:hypothetical protein [Bacillus manliponensis]KEK20410.1 branched-chain amino acid aminotransferase [Bacillus manliponensis]
MYGEREVFQWLDDQKAPFSVRLHIFQAFQMYQLVVEMDKKIMELEKKTQEEI